MLRELMQGIAGSLNRLEVWIRLSNDDARAGLTDYPAIAEWITPLRGTARGLEVQIWTAPNLHAKAVWTDRGALVGSANLTLNGYERNIELSVRLEGHEAVAQASIRDALRAPMAAVTEQEWTRFVAICPPAELQATGALDGSKQPPTEPGWQEFVATLLSERRVRGIR